MNKPFSILLFFFVTVVFLFTQATSIFDKYNHSRPQHDSNGKSSMAIKNNNSSNRTHTTYNI